MMKQYDIGDLLIALSKSSEMDETKTRIFLYLFSKILIGNEDGKQPGLQGNGFFSLFPNEAISDLHITEQEYKEATSFLVSHNILNRKYLEQEMEFWSLESECKWLLKELGPNIRKAEDIKPIDVVINGEDALAAFVKALERTKRIDS